VTAGAILTYRRKNLWFSSDSGFRDAAFFGRSDLVTAKRQARNFSGFSARKVAGSLTDSAFAPAKFPATSGFFVMRDSLEACQFFIQCYELKHGFELRTRAPTLSVSFFYPRADHFFDSRHNSLDLKARHGFFARLRHWYLTISGESSRFRGGQFCVNPWRTRDFLDWRENLTVFAERTTDRSWRRAEARFTITEGRLDWFKG